MSPARHSHHVAVRMVSFRQSNLIGQATFKNDRTVLWDLFGGRMHNYVRSQTAADKLLALENRRNPG